MSPLWNLVPTRNDRSRPMLPANLGELHETIVFAAAAQHQRRWRHEICERHTSVDVRNALVVNICPALRDQTAGRALRIAHSRAYEEVDQRHSRLELASLHRHA